MRVRELVKAFLEAVFPPKMDYTVTGLQSELNLSRLQGLKGVNVLSAGVEKGRGFAVTRMTELTAGYVDSCGFEVKKRELN